MKLFHTKFTLTSILAVALLVSSCNKDSETAALTETSTVSLNIGQTYVDPNQAVATASTGRHYTASTQTVEIPVDNQYTLVATLTPETGATTSLKASNGKATTGTESNNLKKGTKYYVAIFDESGNYKETKTFIQGDSATKFAISKGKYTFVIYTSGTGTELPLIPAGTTLSTLKFTNLTASQDLMVNQVPFEVTDGSNTLNADLGHLFTQISLKLDASALGTVTNLDGASIEPLYTTADVTLSNQTVTPTGTTQTIPFTLKNNTGPAINSDSTFVIAPKTGTNATIKFTGLSIGTSSKQTLSSNWTIRPGVKYTLTVKLKAPLGGFAAGGYIWAPGNLVYNSTGKYTFATPTTLGSSWYYNWLTPVAVGTTPKEKWDGATEVSDMMVYSAAQDPCKLVSPEWRTPSKEEFEALISTVGASTNDTYKNNGVHGVFYGSSDLALMSSNPSAYLFFLGVNGLGQNDLRYWTRTTFNSSNAYSIHFQGYGKPATVNGNDSKYSNEDIQIRCVRNQ